VARVVATVRGHVQGVGFRAWVHRRAAVLGLVGGARNVPDGSVEVVAQGPRDDVRALLDALRGAPDRPGRVDSVDEVWSGSEGPDDGPEGAVR
jgi:acylphosphatase